MDYNGDKADGQITRSTDYLQWRLGVKHQSCPRTKLISVRVAHLLAIDRGMREIGGKPVGE